MHASVHACMRACVLCVPDKRLVCVVPGVPRREKGPVVFLRARLRVLGDQAELHQGDNRADNVRVHDEGVVEGIAVSNPARAIHHVHATCWSVQRVRRFGCDDLVHRAERRRIVDDEDEVAEQPPEEVLLLRVPVPQHEREHHSRHGYDGRDGEARVDEYVPGLLLGQSDGRERVEHAEDESRLVGPEDEPVLGVVRVPDPRDAVGVDGGPRHGVELAEVAVPPGLLHVLERGEVHDVRDEGA
mmetsp:Transcript_449/g.1035  ORF Transcript_449/g.1035 Transcript_449/m.1035 type:complete len:243 (+) Transcript_449:131-859(+)